MVHNQLNHIMRIVTYMAALAVACTLMACEPTSQKEAADGKLPENEQKLIDEGRGIGVIKHVTVNDFLEEDRARRGKDIYEMRCQSCHATDTSTVVGPGWAGITRRRRPEWIMNMMLNPQGMLENDPTAGNLLGEYHTAMPEPGISIGDARDVLEYMRTLRVKTAEADTTATAPYM